MPDRKHVLVVDDDRSLITIMRHLFEAEGFRVSAADDGYAALHRLSIEPVDLVVTDLHMPRCDGAELIIAMRRSGTPTPIILLTSDAEGARALRECCDIPTLLKPAKFEEILAVVGAVLQ